MAIPFEKRWSVLFFVPVLVHIAVDGFLKRLDALAGNGADLVDFLLVHTGKVHKAVASLHIRVLAVNLGNDADGRNVKGKDKIGRNGILGVDAGDHHNDQPGVTGHVDGLSAKEGHLNKFTGCINKIFGVGDLLGFGVVDFLLGKALHQGCFAAADLADERYTVSVTRHLLGIGNFGNIEAQNGMQGV